MVRARRIVAVVLLALLASACSAGESPKPNYASVKPTSTGSASATPVGTPSIPTTGANVRPGETPPTLDPTASQGTAEGAQAFVVYYVKMSDWVFATSVPSILDPLFSRTCETCTASLKAQNAQLAGGNRFRGGRLSLKQIGLATNDGRKGASFAVVATVDVAQGDVVGPSGGIVSSFPAQSDFALTEWVTYVNGLWQIVEERAS